MTRVALHSSGLANTYQHADWTEAVNEEQDSRETKENGERR